MIALVWWMCVFHFILLSKMQDAFGRGCPALNKVIMSRATYRRHLSRTKPLLNALYTGYYKPMVSTINSMVSKVKNGGGGQKTIPNADMLYGIFQKSALPSYKRLARAGFISGLQDVEERYGGSLPIRKSLDNIEINKALTDADIEELGLSSVVNNIATDGMTKVKSIAGTYHNALRSQMVASVAANESRDQLVKRLMVFQNTSKSYAKRIAQTETTKVFNAGALEGYKKSTVAGKKEWSTNLMGNPRTGVYNHLVANGEVVDVNKPFIRTGGSLMYPGDPSGAAGNVIHCYCGMMPVIGKANTRKRTG